MSDLIAISKEELLATVNKFNATGSQLEENMNAVKSQIATMAAWKGSAQVNFEGKMGEWQNAMNNVTMALNDISRALGQFEQSMGMVDSSARF